MKRQVSQRTRSRQLDHKVSVNIKPHYLHDWCESEFGPQWNAISNRAGLWTVFWDGLKRKDADGSDVEPDYSRYIWRFARAEDAAWFKLNWSSK